MPNIPTPIRAALGLAATAVDEARKLPETLPQAVSAVPLRAVSTAMQASLKLQQHLATLSARGDEVLSQLRGRTAEPPGWATFDDSPAHAGAVDPHAGEPAKAAFDRIDYDSADFAADEDGRDRWDAVGVGGAPEAELDGLDFEPGVAGVTAPAPSTAGPVSQPATLAEAVSVPDTTAPTAAAKAPGKAAKKAAPVKAAKAGPAKANPAKATPAKAGAAKAVPAKAKRAGRKAEPLEVAASKAPSDGTPTPSTMAAEILHAHEGDAAEQ